MNDYPSSCLSRRPSPGDKTERWRLRWDFAGMACVMLLALVPALTSRVAHADEGPSQGAETRSAHQWLQQLQVDQLSVTQMEDGVRLALRAQADESAPWDRDWGDFVQLARQKHVLNDKLWGDYLLGAVQFRIRVAASASRGGILTYWVDKQAARVGHAEPDAAVFAEREDDISGIYRATAEHAVPRERMNLSSYNGSGRSGKVDLAEERFAPLQVGPQTFHYRLTLSVVDTPKEKAAGANALATRVVDKNLPWRLLGEKAEPLPPVPKPDPGLREELMRGFHHILLLRDKSDPTLLEVMIQVDHPVADMAFDMSLRVGQDAWPLGPVAWVKGRTQWWAFNVDLPASVRQMEVVLTPSPRAASRLAKESYYQVMDIKSIWDGPPIVLDEAITYQPQAIEMVHSIGAPEVVAREFLLDQLDPNDALTKAIERGEVRTEAFKDDLREPAPDAAAAYRAGCVLMAAGDFAGAMARFVQARQMNPEPALERFIQRPQRKLCGLWLAGAKKGEPQAMAALGVAYEHGWGVGANAGEAKRWYRNGANAGNAEAMCRLASLYEHKTGAVVQTAAADAWYSAQAAEWYGKAANLGNAEAKEWVQNHP